MKSLSVTDVLVLTLLILAASIVVWLSVCGTDTFGLFLIAVASWIGTSLLGGVIDSIISGRRPPMELPAKAKRANHYGLFALICSLLVMVSVVATQWPLRLAFNYAQPSFDKLAKILETKEQVSNPSRVGTFFIKRAEVHPQNRFVCFWIDTNPSGKTGFVQCNSDEADSYFNLWSKIELAPGWQFITED